MIGFGLNIGNRGVFGAGGAAFDADAQAFFDRVTAAGGSLTTTEKNATNQLVLDMKSASIWTSMKAIYPMVGASAAACAQNLKSSSFTGTFSSGWTFSSSGAKGNGTSAKMETALNPNTQLNINSAHISYYSNDAFSVENVFMSNNTLDLFIQQNAGVFYGSLANTAYGLNANPLKLAFMMYNRQSSILQKAIKNNTIIGTNSALAVSFTATDVKLNNYLGTYTDSRCAFASLGDGLTDAQASNLYTAVQTFNTTLSRQV